MSGEVEFARQVIVVRLFPDSDFERKERHETRPSSEWITIWREEKGAKERRRSTILSKKRKIREENSTKLSKKRAGKICLLFLSSSPPSPLSPLHLFSLLLSLPLKSPLYSLSSSPFLHFFSLSGSPFVASLALSSRCRRRDSRDWELKSHDFNKRERVNNTK